MRLTSTWHSVSRSLDRITLRVLLGDWPSAAAEYEHLWHQLAGLRMLGPESEPELIEWQLEHLQDLLAENGLDHEASHLGNDL